MAVPPFNIPRWYVTQSKVTPLLSNLLPYANFMYAARLAENSHLLKPPVGDYSISKDPLTIVLVGGPNARTDYHVNETPEVFYQYRGRMLLKIVEDREFRDVYIDEGELFVLPANTPHNPIRFAGTVGIVIEQKRKGLDLLRWYCKHCNKVVHEASFYCVDLGAQIKTAVTAFEADLSARKCRSCGTMCDVAPSAEEMESMQDGH